MSQCDSRISRVCAGTFSHSVVTGFHLPTSQAKFLRVSGSFQFFFGMIIPFPVGSQRRRNTDSEGSDQSIFGLSQRSRAAGIASRISCPPEVHQNVSAVFIYLK